MKVAVIDLGYNSIKLVNYNILYGKGNNIYRPYYSKSFSVKIGEGLNKNNLLRLDAIERTIESIKYFRDLINVESINHVLPFATSAVREADNKNLFLKKVQEETGFKFRILSSDDEGLYSYYGALNALCVPNCLFFDLGGGSIEIVYVDDYKVKTITSLPLGVLKLTQSFFSNHNKKNNDDIYSEKDYQSLKDYLSEVLPTREELGINNTEPLELIGVGGTLRALARYDQQLKEYPLKKLHNYNLDYNSLSTIKNHLLRLNIMEISDVDSIGKSRAETIKAGLCIIRSLMRKLNFKNVTVSTHGLREGILLNFLESPLSNSTIVLRNQKIKSIEKFMITKCESSKRLSTIPIFINQLLSFGLLSRYEFDILINAIYYSSQIEQKINSLSQFYMLLNEDILGLNHRQQVILAMSIVSIYNDKIVSDLAENYTFILNSNLQNKKEKKIIDRISICLKLYNILKKNISIRIREFIEKKRKLVIDIIINDDVPFPELLLKEIFQYFELIFDISIDSFQLHKKEVKTKKETYAN